MFEYISGLLKNKYLNYAVIDASGLGYKIFASSYSLDNLNIGESATLYIYSNIREDAFDLYGFSTIEERRTFEMLLSVSGVGPKAALSILSSLPPYELALAIISGDTKSLTKANGIGAKVAARIILELKNKISQENINLNNATIANNLTPISTQSSEAEAALIVLGFAADDAKKAVQAAGEGTTEEIIKKALLVLR